MLNKFIYGRISVPPVPAASRADVRADVSFWTARSIRLALAGHTICPRQEGGVRQRHSS
jgi:hypothetical protein